MAKNHDDYFDLSFSELMNIDVSTTSKYSEKLQDAPGNLYVFTREQIQERGYHSVEDILQSMTGVDVQ